MAANLTKGEEESDLRQSTYVGCQERRAQCQQKATQQILTAKLLAQEAEAWVANNVTSNDSERKETLKELSNKYDHLKSVPLREARQFSLEEGSHFLEEYEQLASHVLQLMRRAEDEANGLVDDRGKYGAEGCFAELYERSKVVLGKFCNPKRRDDIREIAFEFSDLLEGIEREKQSLHKLNVHLQSCLDLIDKLKEVETIGKLRMDKLAFVASSLRMSCDAFFNR